MLASSEPNIHNVDLLDRLIEIVYYESINLLQANLKASKPSTPALNVL